MSGDALITLNDLAELTDTRNIRAWRDPLQSIVDREPALRIVVSGQRSTILQLLKANGLTPEQIMVIDQRVQRVVGMSLALLERGHRRLWNEMLPDFNHKENQMSERMPNPFETAVRQHGLMNVSLKADDLMHADPSLTRSDAERLLSMLGPILAGAMIRTGIDLALKLFHEAGQ
jgi:hypothetical protein